MDYPAAPRPGRRGGIGGLAALTAFFLLAPPLFALAPFLLLTLFSRPRTLRELVALVAAGLGTALALQGPGGLTVELLRASGLVLGALFLLLSLRSQAPLFGRALLAVVLTALTVTSWEWARGVSWPEVQQTFAAMLREGYQAMLPRAGNGASANPEVQNLLQSLVDSAPQLARAMPGVLALEGLAGVGLAWVWHHRIAAEPLGQAPAAFRAFRFNDQFVWGAIFTLALLVAPLPPEVTVIAENLLILWVGLYALRGLAIAAAALAAAPGMLRVLLALLALLLIPLTVGVCLALGLADTWLDIRRRLAPPVPGGT
ncbi:MAG TPA: DUF2232 domain-containing protein [Gemmatimonadales bacterium]|jgi:hypothetical protein|nr:DUF2232 domain-containing protein [Gemmatimonadales bacterium]